MHLSEESIREMITPSLRKVLATLHQNMERNDEDDGNNFVEVPRETVLEQKQWRQQLRAQEDGPIE